MQYQTCHQYTCYFGKKKNYFIFSQKTSTKLQIIHCYKSATLFLFKKRGSDTSHQSCLRFQDFQEPKLLHSCTVDLPNKQTLYVFLSIFSSLHSYSVYHQSVKPVNEWRAIALARAHTPICLGVLSSRVQNFI